MGARDEPGLKEFLKELPVASVYGHRLKVEAGRPFEFYRARLGRSGELQVAKLESITKELLPRKYIEKWADAHAKVGGAKRLESLLNKRDMEADVQEVLRTRLNAAKSGH